MLSIISQKTLIYIVFQAYAEELFFIDITKRLLYISSFKKGKPTMQPEFDARVYTIKARCLTHLFEQMARAFDNTTVSHIVDLQTRLGMPTDFTARKNVQASVQAFFVEPEGVIADFLKAAPAQSSPEYVRRMVFARRPGPSVSSGEIRVKQDIERWLLENLYQDYSSMSAMLEWPSAPPEGTIPTARNE